MNKSNINLIQKNVQEAIKSGKLKMHSKKYFIARMALIIISIVIITLALVYLISFVFFVLHIRGVWELSDFGFRGLVPFLVSLPWVLFLVTIIFIIGLELLLKKTTITYRKPLVYSVLGLVFLVFVAGFAFAQLPLHEKLYNRSFDKNAPPFMGEFYKEFGQHPLHNAHPGVIIKINDTGFVMNTHMNIMMNVIVTDKTVFIDNQELKINDQVMVMGESTRLLLEGGQVNEEIIAEAVKIKDGRGMKFFDKKPGSPMHRPLK